MRREWRWLAGAGASLLVLLACSTFSGDAPPPDEADGSADGGVSPDAPASSDAPTNTKCTTPGNVCTPDGGGVVSCTADGVLTTRDCSFGCDSAGPSPKCRRISPSGSLSGIDFAKATGAITVAGEVRFNTDNGSIVPATGGGMLRPAGAGEVNGVGFVTISQPNGHPEIGVFYMRSLDLPSNATLRFLGGRGAGLIVNTSLTVAGTIMAHHDCGAAIPIAAVGGGAGGQSGQAGTGCCPGSPGAVAAAARCGGGGGGNGTAGGAGGEALVQSDRCGVAPGGVLATNKVIGGVLVGGGGGGAGSDGHGGAGGGIFQLVVDGPLVVSGTINAGGCGGVSGNASGGGGAGGTLLLEAATLNIIAGGRVVANGGAGAGSYRFAGAGSGGPGGHGTENETSAQGGLGINCPPGGQGGARLTPALDAGPCSNGDGTPIGAGGGGGAAGQIVLKAIGADVQVAAGAVVSPIPATAAAQAAAQ